MKFTFAHAADIHLDSPLRGLGAYSQELADCFRQASRQAFVNLVDEAIQRRVALLVIAGDVFDGDWRDYTTGLFFVKQMARLQKAGIAVYALAGNHDSENEMSRSLVYPENVRYFSTRKPETLIHEATGTALHGQGFSDRWSETNIAEKYPKPKAGAFNIGVLHTSCGGYADHAHYAPCSTEQLCNHGYDYWALGHIHAHAVLCKQPYVVFPGNLQGRHVRECGAKGFCVVEVTDGDITSFEHICCDVARWCDLTLTLDDANCASETALFELVRSHVDQEVQLASGRPLALRLSLSGTVTLHNQFVNNQNHYRAQIEAVLSGVSDNVMLEKLRIKTSDAKAKESHDTISGNLISELLQEMESPDLTVILNEELGEMRNGMRARLPHCDGVMPDDGELEEILAEARSMVSARLSANGSSTGAD